MYEYECRLNRANKNLVWIRNTRRRAGSLSQHSSPLRFWGVPEAVAGQTVACSVCAALVPLAASGRGVASEIERSSEPAQRTAVLLV